MNSLFDGERKAENRERAAMVKRRVGIDDALAALDLCHEAGDECPQCHGLDLKKRRHGETAECESCGETFDAIALVRAALGLSFNGACAFLERECLGADDGTDDRTGRLL